MAVTQPSIRYLRTADGVSIAYYAIGEGPNLVVTPLHPFSHLQLELEYSLLRIPLERLAYGCRVFRYDRRGTGMSERKPEFTVDSEQLDLAAVVDAVGDGPVCLLGRGLGAPAAIRYTVTHPERVSRLVLYDPFISTGVADMDPNMVAQTAVLRSLIDRDFESMMREILPMAGFVDHDWWLSFFQSATDRDQMRAALDWEEDVGGLLSLVACPTLVIAASERVFAQQVARSIPNAEFRALRENDGGDMADLAPLVLPFLGRDTPAEPETAAPVHVSTVLFTDLVGHTEMMSRLGDTKGRDVLREHERITREVLKENGGTEVKTMGDGFMASFGSVTNAVECAIALQKAFEERDGEPLSVRVGLNAGEPIEEDGDLFGATVILASRIAAKAEGGEILVADTVRGLCSGKGFLFSDRGEFVAKGFEEPMRVYEVSWHT